MSSFFPKILFTIIFSALISEISYAQTEYGGRTCGSAASPGGTVIWDYNDIFDLDMQFCDGSQWFSLLVTDTAVSCSGSGGKMQWNSTNTTYEYCNGTNWIDTKGKVTVDSCAPAGQNKGRMRWNSSTQTMQFCDGSVWISMGPSTVIFNASTTWVVPSYATAIRISVWGGGAGGGAPQTGGGAPAQGANGTSGTASSVSIPSPISLTLTSNGGAFGGGGNSSGGGTGGAGGTASGGDTNVSGGTGVAGEVQGATKGGDGGASYKGGKAGSQTGFKGANGLAPGGGGAGADGTGGRKGGGGGGAGGYSMKQYNNTSLVGLTLTITVGGGGTKGSSQAGDGGAGRVIITYW